mmetsp:Transcript_35290/g.57080  ORF Transcript_35290/g.57080 Transcript_35290/m.57080 type:complete len:87 (-) Transcript_35290:171-431(-)
MRRPSMVCITVPDNSRQLPLSISPDRTPVVSYKSTLVPSRRHFTLLLLLPVSLAFCMRRPYRRKRQKKKRDRSGPPLRPTNFTSTS